MGDPAAIPKERRPKPFRFETASIARATERTARTPAASIHMRLALRYSVTVSTKEAMVRRPKVLVAGAAGDREAKFSMEADGRSDSFKPVELPFTGSSGATSR